MDLDALYARELAPFRAAIAAGTRAVMSAHILVPALDPDRPATLARRILTGLLREELGYDGLIVTDGMEMQAISATYGIERGSVLAIAAGADAICVGGGLADDDTVLRLRDALVAAVRTGELPEERLADAAARVRALAPGRCGPGGLSEPGAARGGARPAPGSDGPTSAWSPRAARCGDARRPTASPRRRTSPPSPPSRTSPSATRPRGAWRPNWPRLLPGTETGSFAGEDAGAAALWPPRGTGASSPSSATPTATRGWPRPSTRCSRPAPTRSWSRWAYRRRRRGAPCTSRRTAPPACAAGGGGGHRAGCSLQPDRVTATDAERVPASGSGHWKVPVHPSPAVSTGTFTSSASPLYMPLPVAAC